MTQYFDYKPLDDSCTCLPADGKIPQLVVTSPANGSALEKSLDYGCAVVANTRLTSGCFEEARSYFDPNNLQVEIVPTTAILVFFLRLNNTNNQTMSAGCIRSVSSFLILTQ